MAGITGMGDTFDLPNFVGELFLQSPDETPFLSAMGGLTGGEQVDAKRFEWQNYDLRAPSNRYRLEGAAAPTAEARVRSNASNVLQIVQEAVELSYTKMAATGQLGDGTIFPEVQGSNPVLDEMDWQVGIALAQIARDLNFSFINGAYAEPADNATARQTRGILAAITSNVVTPDSTALTGGTAEADDELITLTAHGLVVGDRIQFTTLTGGTGLALATDYFVRAVPTANTFSVALIRGGAVVDITVDYSDVELTSYPRVSSDIVGDAMQGAWNAGGLAIGDTRLAVVGGHQKRRLTQAFITDKSFQETTRSIGGVSVTSIETDFGTLNIMIEREMPDDTIAILSFEQLAPVFLPIPGKGFLFLEPLAKTGSSEHAQIYGEVGLRYGDELTHAKITGLG
jgi:hypothetical protein